MMKNRDFHRRTSGSRIIKMFQPHCKYHIVVVCMSYSEIYTMMSPSTPHQISIKSPWKFPWYRILHTLAPHLRRLGLDFALASPWPHRTGCLVVPAVGYSCMFILLPLYIYIYIHICMDVICIHFQHLSAIRLPVRGPGIRRGHVSALGCLCLAQGQRFANLVISSFGHPRGRGHQV